MSSNQKTEQNQGFQSIFSGLLYAFVCTGLITLLVSFLLLWTGLKENSIQVYIFLIHAAALFVGGFITGRKVDRSGWYYGGLMGVIYSIVIQLIGFLGFDAAVSMTSLTLFLISFAMGAVGGILGVNTKK